MKKIIITLFLSFVLTFVFTLIPNSTVYAAVGVCTPPCTASQQCVCDPKTNVCQCLGGNNNASNPLGMGSCGLEEIYTAIGCIPIEFKGLTNFFIKWAVGLVGGIAFLFIVYSGFMILTSSGNPERLKAGQELMTAAVMGLVLVIFSIFILRVIGVDILAIPGLSK